MLIQNNILIYKKYPWIAKLFFFNKIKKFIIKKINFQLLDTMKVILKAKKYHPLKF